MPPRVISTIGGDRSASSTHASGRHIDSTTLGYTQVDEYGVADGENLFEVVALDEAGNASAPASATFELVGCVVQ